MHIQQVIEHFETLGIPEAKVAAYVAATVELLGGISLIFGILTRFFSLLLSAHFITAYALAHPVSLSHPTTIIQQEPFLYLYAALVVLCFGPGLFSFDYWIEKKKFGQPL